jgi:hypothetical protein
MHFEFNRIARGRIDESIINQYFRDISQDIIEQYFKIDELTEEAAVLKKVSDTHTGVLSRINNIIQDKIDALDSGVYANTLYSSDDIFIPSSTNDTTAANAEYEFGIATCGIMNNHRIFTSLYDDVLILNESSYDNINRIISNNKFREKADTVIENDILNAFNPQEKLPYLLTAQTTKASFTIAEIIMNIINIDSMLNYIKIKPQPLLELTLDNFRMNTADGEQPFINPVGEELAMPIQNAENILFTYPETTVSSISMLASQTNKTSTLPYEFLIGFRDIDIGYNEYYNKSYIGFSFPVQRNDDLSLMRLKAVNFNWTYADGYTRAFVYSDITDANAINDNYLDLITTDGVVYTTSKALSSENIYVVVELSKLPTNTSPMLRSVSVQYI